MLFPFYGDPDFMKEAVRSVLRQTHEDWRLVVVDDGYPDDSIPGWFADLGDSRITYMRNEKNLGANGNYRKCLTFVESELVTVMGADDVMLPNYLEWLVRSAAEHPEASVFQPGVVVIDENDASSNTPVEMLKAHYRPNGTTVLTGEAMALSIIRGNWLYFPSLGWRAAAITSIGFREGYDVVQDAALVLDVALQGGGLLYDPTLAFMYRRHSGSDSSVRALQGTRFDEEHRFFSVFADEFAAKGWNRAARAARLHVSSRLHSASLMPKAALAREWDGFRNMLRHVTRIG